MALAILLVLTILVPLMVFYTQRDSIWTVKQAANTTAFHLAEAGVEKGYLFLAQSTITWSNVMKGQAQTGYNFDVGYADVSGGTYAISITSGPGSQQATVITVGRDARKRETRALKVVYSNASYGATAIYAGKGVQIGGQVDVEWGGVMSPGTIDAANRNHPQFWSAGQILTKDTSPNPPNCDSPNCVQWHAYYPNIPPAPQLDFSFYRSSAAANTGGGCPAGGTPAGSCYYAGSVSNWNYTTTGIVFVEGSLTVKSPGMGHTGSFIVMGNVNLPNGQWGYSGSPGTSLRLPPDAWKQYGNDWTFYRNTFDQSAPMSFPGLNSTSYTSPTLCVPSPCLSQKVAVNGFMYVGGNFNNGGGGGGNSDIYGVLYAIGSATQTASSQVTFYYNADAANNIITTNISLSRSSWQDATYGWPPALP